MLVGIPKGANSLEVPLFLHILVLEVEEEEGKNFFIRWWWKRSFGDKVAPPHFVEKPRKMYLIKRLILKIQVTETIKN